MFSVFPFSSTVFFDNSAISSSNADLELAKLSRILSYSCNSEVSESISEGGAVREEDVSGGDGGKLRAQVSDLVL